MVLFWPSFAYMRHTDSVSQSRREKTTQHTTHDNHKQPDSDERVNRHTLEMVALKRLTHANFWHDGNTEVLPPRL